MVFALGLHFNYFRLSGGGVIKAKILFLPCTKCSCLDEKNDISFLQLIAIFFITFLENDSNSDSLLLKIQLQYLNEIVYLDIDTYYDQKGYDELKN